MHEGFDVSSDFIFSVILGVIAWFINLVRSMAKDKITNLETLHTENAKAIKELDKRVTVVETTYVKREDVREVVDALREELYCDLDKSFTRIHERFDNLFEGKIASAAPERRYPSESPKVNYDKRTD